MTPDPIRKRRYLHPDSWWTTEKEKDFLDRIGTFRVGFKYGRYDRVFLLERKISLLLRYRDQYMPLRKNWGKIDPKEILSYLNEKLKGLIDGKSKQEESRKEEKDVGDESFGAGRESHPVSEQRKRTAEDRGITPISPAIETGCSN